MAPHSNPTIVRLPDGSEYEISTDDSRLDVDAIHSFLVGAYWCKDIPRETLERSMTSALCFGLYFGEEQVGFARVISDYATFAYLGDVYVLPDHRGKGLSKRLMTTIIEHPDLQGLRRFMLVTQDAHGLYAQFGFNAPVDPTILMERLNRDSYTR